MKQNTNPKNSVGARRKKLLFLAGFQLRYTSLVAGSLFVLLLFAGFHGVYVARQALPADAYAVFEPVLMESTFRLFLVGLIYIGVLAIAAIFISHRMMGPAARLEEQLRTMLNSGDESPTLKTRSGDDLENLIQAMDQLVKKLKK